MSYDFLKRFFEPNVDCSVSMKINPRGFVRNSRMKNGVCPKCNESRILENVRLSEQLNAIVGGDTHLTVESNPDSPFFSSSVAVPVRAWVCEACGFVEFYAQHPEKLGKRIDLLRKSNRDNERLIPRRWSRKDDGG